MLHSVARGSPWMGAFPLIVVSCIVVHAVDGASRRYPTQPANPIIAHVTMPYSDCALYASPPSGVDASGGCVNGLYVKWLDAVGVRTVPLAWNADWESMRRVLDQTNGVLLPGGDLVGSAWDLYRSNMTAIVNYALSKQDHGDPFLVFGVCQGFQILATILGANAQLLECIYHGVEGVELPLNMTAAALGSVMFPRSVANTSYALFETRPVTLNLHSCGISPDAWNQNGVLRSDYPPLSTNVDADGRPFVSAFAGSKPGSNVLAVQFHPERAQFEFDYIEIGHSDDDLDASWYMARLVRRQLQLCTLHAYPTAELANAAVMANYPATYLGWGRSYVWIPRGMVPMRPTGDADHVPAGAAHEGSAVSVYTANTLWALGLISLFAVGLFGAASRMKHLR